MAVSDAEATEGDTGVCCWIIPATENEGGKFLFRTKHGAPATSWPYCSQSEAGPPQGERKAKRKKLIA